MTPLTPQTHHLIGRKELAQMKRSAILINTARGPIVDFAALDEALRDSLIAGAGLDVFDPEPIPVNDPLLTLDNVVLCPHLGSASLQTRVKMGLMAVENLLAGLEEQPLPYPVEAKAG
jgi:glyoxylate reductase